MKGVYGVRGGCVAVGSGVCGRAPEAAELGANGVCGTMGECGVESAFGWIVCA